MPELRPMNTAYDGHFGILTLGEVISLARSRSTDDRPIRVLAELKHADWSTEHGLPMAELVADELCRLDATDADGPVDRAVRSSRRVLRDVRALLGDDGPQMVQLVDDNAVGDRMVSRAGLREISTYAQGIGPSRERILGTRRAPRRSPLVEEAHRAALSVFCWTLRAENAFLPEHLRVGDAPARPGRRARRGPSAARAGRRRPDHRLPRPRRPGGRGAALTASSEPAPRSGAARSCAERVASIARARDPPERPARRDQSIRSWMTTFSSRPGPTPITLIRAPESSSSRRT